jgi:hypothetical protein
MGETSAKSELVQLNPTDSGFNYHNLSNELQSPSVMNRV